MMQKLLFSSIFFALATNLFSQTKEIKIAFLADVHLQDIYGNFSDNEFKGITSASGSPVLMRTMEAQLRSTRIFNENYFAFLAALEDIAARGVKYVALPGDYTDDGQAIHLRGLKRIMDEYHAKYGIEFFVTTGNHDPAGPFAHDAGKDDFLGEGGKKQPIYSLQGMHEPKKNELPVIITKDIAELGYAGVTDYLRNFGFFPKKDYKFWASPFSKYKYEEYNLDEALRQSLLENRMYDVLPGFTIPDVSYVAEPIEGIWLLAIDGNTYIPKDKNGDSANPENYYGADLGYNNLANKQHLISWIKKIAEEAKRLNKTLIAFSHYPMIDFNDGASPEIELLLGKGKWQLNRIPAESVAETFATAGVTIHFGGHMHINDTGIRTTKDGHTLLNIQTPSLAAYIPAYKLLTVHTDKTNEIETIIIDEVPGFDSLFPLYEMEYNHLLSVDTKDIWNKDILKTKTYREFTDFHLKELVRLRFLPQDWDSEFTKYIKGLSGLQLLMLANMPKDGDPIKAEQTASKKCEADGFQADALVEWTGEDIVHDFYRLRNADELAVNDIGESRIRQYKLIAGCFLDNERALPDSNHAKLVLFFSILNKFLHDVPADHFIYYPENGKIFDLKK